MTAIMENEYLILRLVDALLKNNDVASAIDLLKQNKMRCRKFNTPKIDNSDATIKDYSGRIIYAQRPHHKEIYVYGDDNFYMYSIYDRDTIRMYTYGPTGIESVSFVV